MSPLSTFTSACQRAPAWLRWGLLCLLILWQLLASSPIPAQAAIKLAAVSNLECEHHPSQHCMPEQAASLCAQACAASNCCVHAVSATEPLMWFTMRRPSYISYQLALASTDLPLSTPPPK